ncbi:TolB-like translocation protein [Streptomyces luteolus]|uniref:WD40 repeat domain-containing protein n=1 Tax=Streptomyces luteolus TaxID=3043615 RepID=A0ABT6TAC9_9ACTN|nr:WD40 repeat domain-containing protein [Streptomyces sp. B-S-A12]MDI3424345.1 WD40 repeat domain-containing protein [Streptomyces sp. B-S-A12]
MRSLVGVTGAAALLLLCAAGPAAAADGGQDGFTIEDPRITESSGLAASRAHPGIYWTHNDSDDGAHLYAVDSRTGRTVATLTLSGVGEPRDVEAVSIGPDGDLYVGDIGDNLGGTWDHVWIYRLPEPKQLRDMTVKATQYVVKYADGARDAEALMVHPKTGRVYIADKKRDGGGGLYEGPAELSATGTNVFRRVADVDLWTTDGAFSPDGRRLLLRGYFEASSYAWKDGGPVGPERADVPLQRQGESVTYSPDGTTLMYGSEGRGSEVEPIEAPGAAGDRRAKSPSEGGSSRDGGKGGGEGGGEDGKLGTGAVVIAVIIAAVFGVRRLFRKG